MCKLCQIRATVKPGRMRYYLAYGSNLHPLRLRQRVPSSRLLGIVSLDGYKLTFHKRGQDGSGKCNIVQTNQPACCIHAAIFEFCAEDKTLLDEYEGKGYCSKEIAVTLDGRKRHAYAYIAKPDFLDDDLQPYHWYKELVLHGARFHAFPEHYLGDIALVRSMDDPDPSRRKKISRLILDIQRWEEDSITEADSFRP